VTAFTLLDDGRPIAVAARVGGDTVRVPPETLAALGWDLHDGLLCSDAMCIPVGDDPAFASPHGVDLAALAGALDRPLALDTAEGAAYLGVAARAHAEALASLEAPEFTLPDLSGREHSLSDTHGKKVLLVVWASW